MTRPPGSSGVPGVKRVPRPGWTCAITRAQVGATGAGQRILGRHHRRLAADGEYVAAVARTENVRTRTQLRRPWLAGFQSERPGAIAAAATP